MSGISLRIDQWRQGFSVGEDRPRSTLELSTEKLQSRMALRAIATSPEILFFQAFPSALSETPFSLTVVTLDWWAKNRGPGARESVGYLYYNEGGERSDVFWEKTEWGPLVHGAVAFPETQWQDIWERVRLHLALPAELELRVVGMPEPDPAGVSYWDVKQQPRLEIRSLEITLFHNDADPPNSNSSRPPSAAAE
jgi:hypothetical protein